MNGPGSYNATLRGTLIDLTLPARHGDGRFGSENDFRTWPHSFESHGFQSSTFTMFAHFGTHIDAPRHFLPGSQTIEDVPLGSLVGRGAVFHLHDLAENAEIGPNLLADRDPGMARGDIAILRTDWTDERWGDENFLTAAPYLAGAGAAWLVERGVTAVVYDFPEERSIREEGFSSEDCVVHHTLLGAGIYNIEYVVNLRALRSKFPTIVALPLALVGMDGAPARVIAIDEPETTAPQ